jgi:hypothetical protein
MQVQSINSVILKEHSALSGREIKDSKKPCEGCYTTSVFSKGMSGLAFGMAAPV